MYKDNRPSKLINVHQSRVTEFPNSAGLKFHCMYSRQRLVLRTSLALICNVKGG